MHTIMKSLYIIPLMAVLVFISNGMAQPSPAEVEQDILLLLYADPGVPYAVETIKKVKNNPVPYTDYIETQLILPQSNSELLNDSLTSRYNGLLFILSIINSPGAAQILENAYYETKGRYHEILIEFKNRIQAGLADEEFIFFRKLYDKISTLHIDIIYCFMRMKNDLILEDCIERYHDEDYSIRRALIWYFGAVGHGNNEVIELLQQIYVTPTSDFYKYNKIEMILNEIGGEIPGEGLSVHLLDSRNNLLTGGQLKYYDGGWKDAIDNGDGMFRVETDRSTVSLRMIYAYASQDMADVQVSGGPVIFQTVPCEVQLESSTGQLMDEGTVKYYAGGWRDFGVTSGGTAEKELLPGTCSFRMAYAGASIDKQWNYSENHTVPFSTVSVEVRVQNSGGEPLDNAVVTCYAGGWRDFGTTSSGTVRKELLTKTYTFRAAYSGSHVDTEQDVSVNPVLVIVIE